MSDGPVPVRTKPGELDRASFELLLSRLEENRERASIEYERLRARLIRFFSLHRASQPETLADEAFNRLARRLSEGEAVRNPAGYLSGIARLLAQEDQARQIRQAHAMKSAPPARSAPPEESELMSALEACLEELAAADRELLFQYYGGDGPGHIAIREQLASRERINLNALRNRMLRLRARLARCVEGRTNRTTGRDISRSSDTTG
jgi:DNA-directed RNA polymerase specialized sigma24 family protein